VPQKRKLLLDILHTQDILDLDSVAEVGGHVRRWQVGAAETGKSLLVGVCVDHDAQVESKHAAVENKLFAAHGGEVEPVVVCGVLARFKSGGRGRGGEGEVGEGVLAFDFGTAFGDAKIGDGGGVELEAGAALVGGGRRGGDEGGGVHFGKKGQQGRGRTLSG